MNGDVRGPYVLIPGARCSSKKDVAKMQEAVLAMRAAIDIGHYRVAERIRRDHLLLVCSLCGENWPKTEPLKKQFEKLDPEGGDGIVVCRSCLQRRVGQARAHFPNGEGNGWHNCYYIDSLGRIPGRWACEL